VDKRLNKLSKQGLQLEQWLEELDRLLISQAEIQEIVTDSMQFISSLEFTLDKGLPQEKLVVLRQCIEKIRINKPAGERADSILGCQPLKNMLLKQAWSITNSLFYFY
jgi:hypothetical protein